MKKVIGILFFAWLAVSAPGCSKSGGSTNPTLHNNVNVSEAVNAFNAYRNSGYSTYGKTTALVWNDKLSDAAYKFAQDIASEGDGPGGNIYQTAKGVDIFVYTSLVTGAPYANFAICFQYADNADVKTMIDNTFKDMSQQTFLQQMMDPRMKEFGIGEFHNRWYLFASQK